MDPENNTNPTPAGNPAAAAAPNVNNLFDPETATASEPAAAAPAPAADLASAAAELTSSLESGAPLDNPAPTAPATDPLVSAATPAPAPAPAPAAQPASVFGAPASSAFGTPAAPAAAAAPEAPAPAPETPAPEATPEPPADDAPLKPADPVPGSLGSAQSYSDIEAAEAEAAAKAAAPKKKLDNKTTIIMLAALGVIVVIAIIVAVIMINGGKKTNNRNNNGGNTDPTPVAPAVINTKNLICSREASAEEVAQLSAISADTSITVEYEEDEMTSFTEVTNATYADHLSAEGGKSVIMESYTAALSLNGLASDPFDSTYVIVDTNGTDGSTAGGTTETPDEYAEGEEGENVNPLQAIDNPDGTIVRATHAATPTTLDVSSAVMFGLSSDSDGNVDTALSSVEKIYAARGYTCQAQ